MFQSSGNEKEGRQLSVNPLKINWNGNNDPLNEMPTTRVPGISLVSSKVTYTMLQSFDPFTLRVNSLVGSIFNPFWSKVIIRFLLSAISLTHVITLLRKSHFCVLKIIKLLLLLFLRDLFLSFKNGRIQGYYICVFHFHSKESDSLGSGNNDGCVDYTPDAR